MEQRTTIKRLDQWFIRGIGVIVIGLFATILFIAFFYSPTISFYSGESSTYSGFCFIIKEISKTIWHFRVYDLFLMSMLLLLSILGISYTNNLKSIKFDSSDNSGGIKK